MSLIDVFNTSQFAYITVVMQYTLFNIVGKSNTLALPTMLNNVIYITPAI